MRIAWVLLLAACGVESVAPDAPEFGESSYHLEGKRVRVVASNLSSGDAQSYDSGEGANILAALDADVVAMQEFNFGNNTKADLDAFVKGTFGNAFTYTRQNDGVHIPNGVVSRFPIRESGVWEDASVGDRDFVWARIDVPGPRDMVVVSVHLLTRSPDARVTQAKDLSAYLTDYVHDDAFVVIAGDFNTSARTEPCFGELKKWVNTSGPYPADQNGNGNTNAARKRPYDWVAASSALKSRETAVVFGGTKFNNGAVIDTRVYQPLAELPGVDSSDSGSINMQHMAVVRDFVLAE